MQATLSKPARTAPEAQGVEIVDVDKKPFQALMMPVYDKFMTTPDMKRLVKTAQDTK